VRTALPVQGRNSALSREKAPAPADLGRGLGTRGSAERPTSIRETIIRWLNEEL
jgi:hypothetical protein